MSTSSHLAAPSTAAEVDALLADRGDEPVLLAGGTDLLVQRRAGRSIGAMVDVTNLADAPPPAVAVPGGRIRLSAVAPIAAVATDLGDRLPALRAAIAVFASAQIRNRASIGGNLGTASPSGDLMPPLVAAGATVLVRGATGRRSVPIGEFLLGPRRTDLRPGEWIESVEIDVAAENPSGDDDPGEESPPAGRPVSGFRKIGGRQALAISVVNLAWQWTLAPDGHLTAVRLAVGAAAPTVIRCPRAEALLEGAAPTRELADAAAAELAADLAPIDDLRGSADYRRAAAGGLLVEALLPLLADRPPNPESPSGKETA